MELHEGWDLQHRQQDEDWELEQGQQEGDYQELEQVSK